MRELRLLALDPGIGNAGFSVIEVMDGKPFIMHSENVDLHNALQYYRPIEHFQGDVIARCHALRDRAAQLLEMYQPDYVAYEDQFVGGTGNVSSYTKTIRSIEYVIDAAIRHRLSLPIINVGASEVKKYMGVKGYDKGLMTDALRNAIHEGRVSYGCLTPLHLLTEHAVDSICIGLFSIDIYLGRYAYAT